VKNVRSVIEQILSEPVKLVVVQTGVTFVHLDKLAKGNWRLTVSKSLLEQSDDEGGEL
jgi:hypothetical protein